MRHAPASVTRDTMAEADTMRDDWQTLGVADLGRAIDAGQIDPAELTEAYLDAIASA